MKIIHLLANNIKIWAEYLDKTEYYVNAFTTIDDLEESIIKFNARDVLGFILYPSSLNTAFLNFLSRIDKKYVTSIPVILITSPEDDKTLQSLANKYTLLDILNLQSVFQYM